MVSEPKGEWQRRAFILSCAAIMVLPLVFRGNSCGHDFDFHLESWMDVAQQWRAGLLYPHWAAGANYGAGEPRFVFYPPLSWMLGALLGTIFTWAAAPVALSLIAFAGCGASMYALAREWVSRDTAAVAACVYLANPYLLFVAYERTAYGELLAAIWLPLIFLFAFPDSNPATEAGAPEPALSLSKGLDSETWVSGQAHTIPLALTIAAVWLTNAPAAVMACYALGLVALFTSILKRRWAALVRTAEALLLGLGLAAFYIVPAAWERRWVEIDRAIGPGMRIKDSFLFGHTGEAFHDQVLRTASWIAVAMLAVCVGAAWIAWRRGSRRTGMSAAVLLVAFLLLPVSRVVWQHAPELKFLQFPWRLLLLLGIVLAGLIGAALSDRPETPAAWPKKISATLLFAIGMAWLAAALFWQPCDEEDAVSAQTSTYRAGIGFEGTDEYTTLGADNSAIQQGLPRVRILNAADADAADSSIQPNPEYAASTVTPAKVTIANWNAERMSFQVDSPTADFAVLRLLDYPAWRVHVNGVPVEARPHRDDGLLTIPLRSGISRVQIGYADTSDVWWGSGLSLASLLALIALASAQGRRRPHRLS